MADLGDYLIKKGILGPEQLQEAQTVATSRKLKLQDTVVQLGYATAEQVMRVLAEQHDYEYYDLDNVPIPPAVVELVPESVARENAVIPFSEEDGKLKIVVSDPLDFNTFDKLKFILNREVEIGLATREKILEAINRNYGQMDGESADSMLQEFTDTAIDFTETEDDADSDDESVVDENSAPVVRLVQLMITEAVQLRASDIHVEPFESRIRIRYRIDGVLVERDSPPRRLLSALLSRIKILAKMDIAERRRTQDGRIKITAGGSRTPFSKARNADEFLMTISDGKSVFVKAVDMMASTARIALAAAGLSVEDMAHWVPHQANTRIIEATRTKLAMPPENTLSSVVGYGNSSAATIPFTMSLLADERNYQQGDRLLLTAAGAGLTGGAIVWGW